ncbi:MAG TPA: CocE/NonD family hydrolase C-terminal non-catalytic domain-containing protein, partial [Streptosporangiaceae bacterium]|nr:CocE/NonD family hydrolase C-terminal non-catalytic domain-containing protein [Streptosporangiaceae bacterium]
RGLPPGAADDEPPVQIFVQGPEQLRYEQDWPLPDERRVRLFLSGTPSATSASRSDGSLAAALPADAATAAYDFDPAASRNPVAVPARWSRRWPAATLSPSRTRRSCRLAPSGSTAGC